MAKFNVTSKPVTVKRNLAGGLAYGQKPKEEFTFLVLTTFLKGQFYRSEDETVTQMQNLIPLVEPEYMAKLALFARREYGMRSISHILAAVVSRRASGQSWLRPFLEKVFKRPDDMTETVAAYFHMIGGRRPLPNALKRAIRARLASFSGYSLAKYRSEGKNVKMVDLVNLTHPKSTRALDELVKGQLKSTETWEAKLSEAGQKGETAEQVGDLKREAWETLLREGKLGYFALLRNLRNIVEQAYDMVGLAAEQLVDPKRIKGSLVLPFRFVTAAEELSKIQGGAILLKAIGQATEIAFDNVPSFEGRTLVALDVSGSMVGLPAKIGSLFAAAMLKRNPSADFMVFSDDAFYRSVNTADSLTTIASNIRFAAGGTNFRSVLELVMSLGVTYDRIIFLSDMQGWIGQGSQTLMEQYNQYAAEVGQRPHLYSFDLQGYGTTQFPADRIYCLAGFSEKVFDTMRLLEEDRNALVNKIESISLTATEEVDRE